MKNKLLFSTALVAAAFAAGSIRAEDVYVTGETPLTQQWVDENASGKTSADNRVMFTNPENWGTPVNVVLNEDVEMSAFANMASPTTITGGRKLTVNGFLTAGEPGSDLSGIDLAIGKTVVTGVSPGASAENQGELVIANSLKVGNVEMKDGTGLWLYANGEDETYATNTKTLEIAAGKTLTFQGNNYVDGSNINNEEGKDVNTLNFSGSGSVKNDGILTLKKDVILNTALENTGRIALGENTTFTANKKLSFDGTYEPGKFVGISSDNVAELNGNDTDADHGTLIINDGIELKNGAGVWVNDIVVNSGDIIIDGAMDEANPDNEAWRAGSMLGANNSIKINNADVAVSDGGQFSAGNGGLEFKNSVINLSGSDGKEALLRAWGDDNGMIVDKNSIINVNGHAAISANQTSVAGTINLDGTLNVTDASNAVDSKGNLTLENGAKVVSVINSGEDFGKITGNVNVAKDGIVTLDTKLANGITSFEGQIFADGITLNENAEIKAGNTLFNGNVSEDGTVSYTKKNSGEIAAATGASATQAAALLAVTGGESGNAGFNKIAETVNTLAQSGNKADIQTALNAVEDMGADAAPVVRTTQTNITNQIFSAVSSQLSGGSVASASEGASSGDAANGVNAWVRTLMNHGELDDTSKAYGFDSDTYGVALGIDKQINAKTKAGIGYAYTQTDIDSHRRSTDVDTHTAMLYGEYRPSNWYINGIAAYSWSRYDESKSVLGINADAKYDVNTLGLQAVTGYDMRVKGFNITPEAGLRYVRIDQESYTDHLGTKIGSDTSDILTGIIGIKAGKDFALDNGINIRPEARAAITYDLTEDSNNAAVTLANGSGYLVDGEDFGRFGVETGLGVAADISDNWELSAGYEGHYRDDYADHSGMLNARYKF